MIRLWFFAFIDVIGGMILIVFPTYFNPLAYIGVILLAKGLMTLYYCCMIKMGKMKPEKIKIR